MYKCINVYVTAHQKYYLWQLRNESLAVGTEMKYLNYSKCHQMLSTCM